MQAARNYPDGKIHIVRNKGRLQYYLRTNPQDKSGVYIPKKQTKLVRRLLQKKYNEEALVFCNSEIHNLEQFLEKSTSKNKSGFSHPNISIQKIYSDYPPEIQREIIPIDISDAEYLAQWAQMPYETKGVWTKGTGLKTDRGEIVRSKSEMNIANALYRKQIPYRYECPLKLSNGQIIHPDFTLPDVRRRRDIYWEHRGMMDDREYAKESVKRLRDFARNGIFLGDSLIVTEETMQMPLGMDEIRIILEHYFW